MTIAAPAAVEMSVEPESCVAKPSTGAACAMSSALPAATRRVSSMRRIDRTTIAPREHVRERAAQLARADNGDVLHRAIL